MKNNVEYRRGPDFILNSLIILRFLFALATVILPYSAELAAQCPKNIEFRELTESVFTAEVTLSDPSSFMDSSLLLVRIDPKQLRLSAVVPEDGSQKGQRESVREMVNRSNAVLGINSNFFDREGQALGLLIRNGKLLHKPQTAGKLLNGVFLVKGDEVKIEPRPTRAESIDPKYYDAGFQSGPLLIANGKPAAIGGFPDESNRRSAAAVNRNGQLVLLVTRSRFPGLSLSETQRLLLCPELNILSAINFDGGSSSQLFIRKSGKMTEAVDISGGEKVPAALAAFSRKQ